MKYFKAPKASKYIATNQNFLKNEKEHLNICDTILNRARLYQSEMIGPEFSHSPLNSTFTYKKRPK